MEPYGDRTRIPQPVAQSSQAVRPRTPRRVTFNPMTETATPLPGPHNPEVQYYRTIDGDFPIPFSNIPRAEKRDAILVTQLVTVHNELYLEKDHQELPNLIRNRVKQ